MKDIFGAKNSVFFELYAHRTFKSKYRRRVSDARAINVLPDIFAKVCADVQATLVLLDDEDD